MNFQAAVSYLLDLGHETLAIKLGLRNTEFLFAALDHPDRAFVSVQIAGTNGKGSTAAMLDSICRTAGIKTGLYTSPHLVSITERIRISGIEITPENFAACATTVRAVSEQLLRDNQIEGLPTFFEQLTAIALLAFRTAGVELAILETGLGGRLDSTTAANARIVGITSIAFDHQEFLGKTIESIAAEKAAIIRPGARVVIGRQPEPAALQVLLKRCEKTGVVPVLASNSHANESVVLGLRGLHQLDNAAVAVGLAESLEAEGFLISHSAIAGGLKTVQHDGRLELIPHEPSFLIDGAHNSAGAQALRDYLDEFAAHPLTLVFGAMRDKQLEQMGEILFPIADALVLTMIDNPRSATLETLQTIASRFAPGTILTSESSAEALRTAIANTPRDGLICIAGSLYLIGELRPLVLNLS
jgi:dihydrofolate synthase/folylpolyglutamate synthase